MFSCITTETITRGERTAVLVTIVYSLGVNTSVSPKKHAYSQIQIFFPFFMWSRFGRFSAKKMAEYVVSLRHRTTRERTSSAIRSVGAAWTFESGPHCFPQVLTCPAIQQGI